VDKRYKIIIFSKRIYKEVELPVESKKITLGTFKHNDIRLAKEKFFEDFEIKFTNNNGDWVLRCDENIYISTDGVMKLVSRELSHGDDFILKYQRSNQEIFRVSFVMDFDFEKKDYAKEIDISYSHQVTIGGNENCDIILRDELIGADYITLVREQDKLFITDNCTRYGLYVNGLKVRQNSEIKDYDFFSILGFSFYYKEGKLYTSSMSSMDIPSLLYGEKGDAKSHFEYPKFNRNTRIISLIPDEKISILDPPQQPNKPKRNVIMKLAPAFASLGLTVVLRGVMGGGGSFILFSVCSMGLGILTSVYGMIDEDKEYRKSTKDRKKTYSNYIDKKRDEIEAKRREELQIISSTYFSLENEVGLVEDFSGDLFNRSYEDEDFLDVRLGIGESESMRQIEYKKLERFESDDSMAVIPEQITEEYRLLNDAPVVLKLTDCGAVGVVGDEMYIRELCKNILLDICIRQYYSDVKIFFVIEEEYSRNIEWIRLLPHLQNDDLGIRNIVCNEESRNILFEYLYKELSRRENSEAVNPRIVVFVYNEIGMKRHPISQYIEKAKDLGVTFIFFEEYKELLPLGCQKIIILNRNEYLGKLIDKADSTKVSNFRYEYINDKIALNVAVKLSPVFCEEVSLEGSLTKNISLYELLGILNVDDLEIDKRWETSEVYKSMAAPLGVNSKKDVVCLDLNEKHHGPHGLVAGTTGSGKSEILQSYILSMATLFHPYEVGFVIIDFKGGGMVNQFKNLPHLIGAITNIDGREIDRSLLSIKAELRKRQELFAAANVNHIDAYIKLFKKGEVQVPLPHLILIVDEFAELKMDQPDFMKELISAARIGRSLGVHLILATQKPSGVVDAQIWSNSKFKLCLKVQNKEDSNEVLKTPLAAEIKEPGRAYLQVGNNEIFELFQSAYSGASTNMDESAMKKEHIISSISLSGKRTPVYISKKGTTNKESDTQLEAVVNYIHNYCENRQIEQLPGICMPPLADLIVYEETSDKKQELQTLVRLGIYDDPNNQQQKEISMDIQTGNTFILGSSQYGKTCLLQTMIRGIADKYTPDEVSLYILDFGSMALSVFDGLNHLGGIVLAADDEKLKNLIKMLNTEIKERKEKLSKIGITSFSSYKEAGYTDMNNIIVMVDNFLALKELYPEYEENIINICREGNSVGISMIVTAKQTSGISYKYMSNFSNRICLYCNTADEYRAVFDKCRIQPKNVPGRGLVEINKNIYEYQTYLAFQGEKEIDRVEGIKVYVKKINERFGDVYARRIPEVPQLLNYEYMIKNFKYSKQNSYRVPVGIDYDSVELNYLDFMKIQLISITGRDGSGKTNLVKVIFHYLRQGMFDFPVKAYIVDDYQKRLSSLKTSGIVEKYTVDYNEFEPILEEINTELKERLELLMDSGMEALQNKPLLFAVIKNSNLYSANGISKNAIDMLKDILKNYRQLKVCFLFSDVENAPVAYGASELLKLLKDSKNNFVFEDLSNLKFTEVAINYIRQYRKEIELGDSYFITEKGVQKQKIIYGTDEEV
jgi:DNA segregation ATPase FtsK/SpoIIIE, S-DNA-T family